MNHEQVNAIISMFPAEKPVCLNYQQARNIVMELLDEIQPNQIFNLVVNKINDDGTGTWVVMYHMRKDMEFPEKAFRAAITEFCESDEGTAMVSYAGGSPNWGDILSHIPDDFMRSKGFFPFGESVDVDVEHDEIVYTSPNEDS